MKFDRLRSFHGESQDGAPRGIARFDSAAAMAQAVGAFLHRRDVSTLSGSPLLDRTMPLVNRLPRRLREWAYSLGGMTEAVERRAHALGSGTGYSVAAADISLPGAERFQRSR